MNNNIIQFVNTKDKGGFMNQQLNNIRNKKPIELLIENNISLEPPIDLDKLIKCIGINVRELDFSSIEKKADLPQNSILGAALLVDDNLTFFHKKYEKKRNDHGKRFTLAHELGHCVLHTNDLEVNHLELRNEIIDKKNKKERDANIFAGELLIPEESLKRIYKRLLIPSLKTLAEIFDVSTKVMKKRLEALRLNYYNDTIG